jgi:hypothetical protein
MIQQTLTLLVAVLSIFTGIFSEIRTTLIYEMRAMDLAVFSSLMRIETISDEKKRNSEKEILKKYLSYSEVYRLHGIHMCFITLYVLLATISSAISFLCSNIAVLFEVSIFFVVLTFVFGILAMLMFLGGYYTYIKVPLLEKLSWRISEFIIPNFAGLARDKEITRLIEKNAEIKSYLEELEDNKRFKMLLSYSKFAVFP